MQSAKVSILVGTEKNPTQPNPTQPNPTQPITSLQLSCLGITRMPSVTQQP